MVEKEREKERKKEIYSERREEGVTIPKARMAIVFDGREAVAKKWKARVAILNSVFVFLLSFTSCYQYAESFSHTLPYSIRYAPCPKMSTTRKWSIENTSSQDSVVVTEEEETITTDIEEEIEERETAEIKNGYTTNSNVNGYSMTSGYSRFLDQRTSPRWLTKIIGKQKNIKDNSDDMDEDGYAEMSGGDKRLRKRVMRFPIKAIKKVISKDTKEPGTLILVRHGESEWNRNKTFTGWADPGE